MQVTPAQATLNALSEGQIMAELAQSIHDAVAAVNAHNKPASVTLTIAIAPMKKDGRLADAPLLISGEIGSKLPRPDPAQTLFYTDDNGNPTRTRTRQPDLPLSIAHEVSNG